MLTRTLATLTLLLTLSGGAGSKPQADRSEPARRAQVADDLGGCREPPPSPIPVAPAACDDEARP
jgi:hypothetical protein